MATLLLASSVLAVLLSPNPQAAAPAFDVASVKPASPPARASFKTDPGRLAASGMTLSDLLQRAYGVAAPQIIGAPDLGRFDVEGNAEGTHTRQELLAMLQTLLAERFKLTLHREMRELPVEALVVDGKRRPNLQSVAAAGDDPGITTRVDRSKGPVDFIGVVGKNVRLADLANYLSGRMNRMVVDRTGIEGVFDFDQDVRIDRDEIADKNVPVREVTAHIFEDFVKAVGLKLESQRAPVEMLVVDHAEKPDQN